MFFCGVKWHKNSDTDLTKDESGISAKVQKEIPAKGREDTEEECFEVLKRKF